MFNLEDGEVVYPNEEDNPYIADPSFVFKNDPLHKINWRQLTKIDFRALKYGEAT